MLISGWKEKYSEILKQFRYSEEKDRESAALLNSFLKESDINQKISNLIGDNVVFVIGSGPSLPSSIPKLKRFKKSVKIAADSSIKLLVENGIMPDIIVTDLDGDEAALKKISKTESIFVVHAHGDNIKKLELAKNFKNCIGTTQTEPFGKMQNFGGFTDGDRSVFLASHFNAKKIILFGMDFGNRIGRFSNTKKSERKAKLMKLKKAESLLEWLASSTESELLTTSKPIKGFKKIRCRDLDVIIAQNAFNTHQPFIKL